MLRTVFFGSTPFSLTILQAACQHLQVIAVVTTKPKPRGRGLKAFPAALESWTRRQGIPMLEPETPRDPQFVVRMSELRPDLMLLAAYGHILPMEVLRIPARGSVNVHPSLLPRYRGAAPIQRALMDGADRTGVTFFLMDEKIDHGGILKQIVVPIRDDDDYGSLADHLAVSAAAALAEVVSAIESGEVVARAQDDAEMTPAPKIRKEETVIDWSVGRTRVLNLVRALAPEPGARTHFRSRGLAILKAQPGEPALAAGTIALRARTILCGTGDGSISLLRVRPENRSEMSGNDFVNGYRVKEGERLE